MFTDETLITTVERRKKKASVASLYICRLFSFREVSTRECLGIKTVFPVSTILSLVSHSRSMDGKRNQRLYSGSVGHFGMNHVVEWGQYFSKTPAILTLDGLIMDLSQFVFLSAFSSPGWVCSPFKFLSDLFILREESRVQSFDTCGPVWFMWHDELGRKDH